MPGVGWVADRLPFRAAFAAEWVAAQAGVPVLRKKAKRHRGAGLPVQFIYYLMTTIR